MINFEKTAIIDHEKFVRYIFQLCFSLLLCGCGAQTEILSRPINETSTYSPDASKDGREADGQKYRIDKEECFKQVQSATTLAMTEATNSVKFRKCLVGRGYILMS